MSIHRRFFILRIDYAFAIIIPSLLAIYINNLDILSFLDILVGFLFFTITGNTINDSIDCRKLDEKESIERTKKYSWKEIAVLSIVSFILGISLFLRTFKAHSMNLLLLAASFLMVILYCFKKDIPIFNQFLLIISHIFFPYLIIKIDAGFEFPFLRTEECFVMGSLFFFGIAGESVHEAIDKD